MITREADYAIRVMLYLSKNSDKSGPVTTDAMAEETQIPYRFLRRIVGSLARGGLIQTMRGRGGGMRAARPAASISLKDVILAVNPRSLTMNECLNGDSACPRKNACVVRCEVAKVQKILHDKLQAVRFSHLVKTLSTPSEKGLKQLAYCS